ncbi:MAG TPA: 3'-5' exonuclease [Opitutus sp.]|nr:3'-5' exonuclease [Opitutus sp.]
MAWIDQPIYFVDFEGNQASGVLEYGVVEVRDGRIGATQTRLCRATGRVRPEDEAVHGLTAAAVAKCAPFADEWELFAGLRERGPLAAHYAGTENALIKSAWPYPRSSPDFARPGEQMADWGPWIDTARIYAQLYPEFATGRLEALVVAGGLQAELDAVAARHCPEDRRRYHAALYDALAGGLLLASLAREARLRELSVMQLLALSTLDPARRAGLQQTELF